MSDAVSSRDVQVEATGETVGEAKWNALRELERQQPRLDKASVRFQVLSEGERGILGVGYAPARVLAHAVAGAADDVEAARDESSAAGAVRELLERVTRELGVDCRIDVAESEERLVASCSGGDLGTLIGRHGQTIDAIQYLANAIVARRESGPREVVIDAAGYRERRRTSLEAIAVRAAERVVADGMRVELEPMSASERKVVHLRLKEFPGVETTSEGTEPNRYVVIVPAAADADAVA